MAVNPNYFANDSDAVVAVFQIGLSVKHNFYNREVYNLFDWFSDIGGIQGILLVFASGISSIFSSTLVSIQKAELIYKYLPSRRISQEQSDSLRSADEVRLDQFRRLVPFKMTCLQKTCLILCCSQSCRTKNQNRLRRLIDESERRE